MNVSRRTTPFARCGSRGSWAGSSSRYYEQTLECLAKHYKFGLDVPFRKLPEAVRRAILFGSGTANMPLGVANTPGIQSVTVGGANGGTLSGGWTVAAVATNVSVAGASGSFSVYQHGADNIYAVIDDAVTRNIS